MASLVNVHCLFQTVSVPHSQKTKDGQLYIEYHGDDVQDSVYYAVLQHAYNMFKVSQHSFGVDLMDAQYVRKVFITKIIVTL